MPTGRFHSPLALLLAVALMVSSGEAPAQSDSAPSRGEQALTLALFKSGLVELEKTPSQISVGNPGIADVLILRGTQVHVVAKALGSTNVVFWDRSNTIFATVDIEVTHDLESLKEKLFTLLPKETIAVHSAQENLVLKGSVSSAVNLQAALDIAKSYLPECIVATSSATDSSGSAVASDGQSTNAEGCKKATVINLLSVGGSQQVMLEVKIAEMSRTFLRNLDTDLTILNFDETSRLGAIGGGATSPIGPPVDSFDPFTPGIQDTGLFFSKLLDNDFFRIAMEISRSKGLSKILAEPNLTTLTGRQAKFVSGGEFPIPIVAEDGAVEVVYKEFGVIVDFLPTILDDSRISLDLDIGVSDLRLGELSNGYPIIDKRGASSTVELENGQTIGIAGLIQDDLAESFSRLPGLGDIPVLGTLFRSQRFQSGQTELVMFVTPHLAKPISPDLIRLPTDSFVPPNDVEFYLLGRMASSKEPEKKSYRRAPGGGFDGVTFGHKL